jgi:hypothetical protein
MGLKGAMVKHDDLKAGMKLRALRGFTCLTYGRDYTVYERSPGSFIVECDIGDHFLDGQKDQDGYLVGFELIETPA